MKFFKQILNLISFLFVIFTKDFDQRPNSSATQLNSSSASMVGCFSQ